MTNFSCVGRNIVKPAAARTSNTTTVERRRATQSAASAAGRTSCDRRNNRPARAAAVPPGRQAGSARVGSREGTFFLSNHSAADRETTPCSSVRLPPAANRARAAAHRIDRRARRFPLLRQSRGEVSLSSAQATLQAISSGSTAADVLVNAPVAVDVSAGAGSSVHKFRADRAGRSSTRRPALGEFGFHPVGDRSTTGVTAGAFAADCTSVAVASAAAGSPRVTATPAAVRSSSSCPRPKLRAARLGNHETSSARSRS